MNPPEPFAAIPGAEIGGCVLIERIGHGGQAPVWKARQKDANDRIVAVKLLPFEKDADSEEVQRLEREIHLAREREHPSLVPVYRGGRVDGCVFYVMPFIEGGHLGQFVRDAKPDAEQCAELLKAVTSGVARLHSLGIIHRDLKPANILMQDGRPLVADFGLAKSLNDPAPVSLTGKGAILGTPDYMAPEQAAAKPAGKPADVWALGVILYEMLTGSHPLDAVKRFSTAGGRAGEDGRIALLGDMLRENRSPPSLRQTHRGVDGWLADIVADCLKADPAARYADAAELHEDLDRYFRGLRPLRAQGRSLRAALAASCRRHPFAWTAGGAAVVLAIAFGAYYIHSALALAEKDRDALEKITASELRARRSASEGDVLRASKLLAENEVRPALSWLARALRRWPENKDAARMAWLILLRERFIRPAASPVATAREQPAHRPEVWLGSRIVARPDHSAFTVRRGMRALGVWDEEGREIFPRLQHPALVTAVRFSPDGSLLVTGDSEGAVRLWDARSGKLLRSVPTGIVGGVADLQFTSGGKRIAVMGAMADSENGKYDWEYCSLHAQDLSFALKKRRVHERVNYAGTTVTSDGQWLITGDGLTTRIYCLPLSPEAVAGQQRDVPDMEAGHHTASVAHPTKPWALFLGQWNRFRVWDKAAWSDRFDEERIFSRIRYTTAVRFAASTPDGRYFAMGGTDPEVRVFDWEKCESAGPVLKHEHGIAGLAFSPDGESLLTLQDGGVAMWWDWRAGRPLAEGVPPMGGIPRDDALPLAKPGRFVTLEADGTLQWWQLSPAPAPQAQWQTARGCAGFDISTDKCTALLSGRADGALHVHIESGGVLAKLPHISGEPLGHPHKVRSRARISPDAKFAATWLAPDCIAVHELAQPRRMLWNWQAPSSDAPPVNINICAFNQDSSLLAIGCSDGTLVVRRVGNGTEVFRASRLIGPEGSGAEGSPGEITAIRFSPDGLYLAAGTGQYCTLCVWDTRSWRLIHEPNVLNHVAGEIEFSGSASAPRLWLASWAGTVELYGFPAPAKPAVVLMSIRHGKPVLGFSLDGLHIATASADGTAAVWETSTGLKLPPSLKHYEREEGTNVHDCVFSPDGEVLATCAENGGIRLWSTNTLQPLGLPLVHPTAAVQVAFVENGTSLVVACADGAVRKWRVFPKNPIAPLGLPDALEKLSGIRIEEEGTASPFAGKAGSSQIELNEEWSRHVDLGSRF